VTIRYQNQLNTWTVQATQRAETEGVGAKTISQIQPGAIPQTLPDLPSIPAYPGFPAFDDIYLPTGFTNFNLGAIGPNDGAIIITPLPPETLIEAETANGNVVAHADLASNQLLVATDFNHGGPPTWEVKFTASLPFTIKAFKFDPFNRGAYMLTNDGSSNSVFYRTEDIFAQIPEWVETEFSDIDYTTIRTTATDGEVYIFGIDDRIPPSSVTFLNTNTNIVGDLEVEPSSISAPHGGSSNAPGIYDDSGSYNLMEGSAGGNGGVGCNVQFDVPARAIIKQIQYYAQSARPATTTEGEKTCQVSLDGVSVGSTNSFGSGTWTFPVNPLSGTGTLNVIKGSGLSLSLTGSTLLFHSSIDKKESDGGRAAFSQITVWMADSGNVQTAFRRTANYGTDFFSLKTSGVDLTTPATPGYDTGAEDTTVLMAADDVVRGTDDFGITFGGKAGSTTTGTYAKAIKAYGTNGNICQSY
jgi:hypothetical protein